MALKKEERISTKERDLDLARVDLLDESFSLHQRNAL